jgi:hypothetical protein
LDPSWPGLSHLSPRPTAVVRRSARTGAGQLRHFDLGGLQDETSLAFDDDDDDDDDDGDGDGDGG